jgi:hypothetical protein
MQSICAESQVEGTDLGTFVITASNISYEADRPCEDANMILAAEPIIAISSEYEEMIVH